MEWKLEVVPVPVSDIDRAKRFYAKRMGFIVDIDDRPTDTLRIVQLTPPGSGCSILLGAGTDSAPGSLQGLQLVVSDIETGRAELVARGVECSPIRHFTDGGWVEGKGGDWNSFVSFEDPDGNGWVIQERPAAKPG